MPKLLIATSNQGKIKELEALLKKLDVELLTPTQMNLQLTVEEDGKTYQENAAKKAPAYSRESGWLTLADDSGLEVDAPNGAPGLHSARYAPKANATDADRRRYLLENLKPKPRPWSAHFHATIAIATPQGQVYFAEGNCYGEILPEERGENGFGYDPIFYFPEAQKTMAELSSAEKNRISHRAAAVKNALHVLRPLLSAG